ncbi:MAG TPA: beta-ketoacyl-[acyl-carrier-protein] synthase family protein [Thermoanaerobaculia bacterium]|jgi:3-oxoacyl-[acyl-carrier-protein] synthase II
MKTQVVVTGMGALSAIGNNIDEFRQGLVEGRDGIARLNGFDPARHRFDLAGELKGFVAEEHFSPEELPHLSRGTQMTRVAAAQALSDAGIDLAGEDRTRIGVILGTDLGGMPAAERGYRALHFPYRSGRAEAGDPWASLILDSFICSVADQLAQYYGLTGTTLVVSTACSAGLHAIGIGADAIRRGDSEVMLVGGVDPLSEMPHAGFGVLRSLANGKIKPFSKDRNGTVLGEAASILVLESEEHARRRGANILCEIAGYGASTDAYHMTRPDDTGAGPARAMQQALDKAGLAPEQIDYIKAHGTATPANDVIETRAIKRVFGDTTTIPVSSVKSMIGHSLGASGAVEAAAAILALLGGFLPPTINLDIADPECDLDYVPHHSRRKELRAVLANAFGFGGNNAAMVFRSSEIA